MSGGSWEQYCGPLEWNRNTEIEIPEILYIRDTVKWTESTGDSRHSVNILISYTVSLEKEGEGPVVTYSALYSTDISPRPS